MRDSLLTINLIHRVDIGAPDHVVSQRLKGYSKLYLGL